MRSIQAFTFVVIVLILNPREIDCHSSSTALDLKCKVASDIFKGALNMFEPYEKIMADFEYDVGSGNYTEDSVRAACTDPFVGLHGAVCALRFMEQVSSHYIHNDGNLKTEFMIKGMLQGLERHHAEISETFLSSSHEVFKDALSWPCFLYTKNLHRWGWGLGRRLKNGTGSVLHGRPRYAPGRAVDDRARQGRRRSAEAVARFLAVRSAR